jgi:hypothetical protein
MKDDYMNTVCETRHNRYKDNRRSNLLGIVGFIFIVFTVFMIPVLCTGFNRNIFDTNYTFDVAITRMPDGTQKVIKIKKWLDYEGEQVQITATDGTIYLLSMNNTVLIKNPK